MKTYIEREALRAEALRLTKQTEFPFDNCFPYWQFSKCIKEAPAVDAVPVVRCKDCVKRFDWNNGCGVCRMIGQNMNDDDFCSYGERKEAT